MTGLVKRLGERHRDAILEHFLSMDEEGLRLRFGTRQSEESLRAYVGRLDFSKDGFFGILGEGAKIIGFAHAGLFGTDSDPGVEIGFSVLAQARGQGLGQLLLEHVLLHARNQGARRALMYCLPENHVVKHLAHKWGMEVHQDYDEATSRMELPRPDFMTLMSENYHETLATQDEMQKTFLASFSRILAAMSPKDEEQEVMTEKPKPQVGGRWA